MFCGKTQGVGWGVGGGRGNRPCVFVCSGAESGVFARPASRRPVLQSGRLHYGSGNLNSGIIRKHSIDISALEKAFLPPSTNRDGSLWLFQGELHFSGEVALMSLCSGIYCTHFQFWGSTDGSLDSTQWPMIVSQRFHIMETLGNKNNLNLANWFDIDVDDWFLKPALYSSAGFLCLVFPPCACTDHKLKKKNLTSTVAHCSKRVQRCKL